MKKAPIVHNIETVVTVDTAKPLTLKTRRLIDQFTKPFQAFASEFHHLTLRRDELAPKLMRAFTAYQAETGLSFVDFTRVLDPSIPADREGYRAHAAYQAADYLRRLYAQSESQPSSTDAEEDTGPSPEPPFLVVGRLVASVLPLIGSAEGFWKLLASDCHWTPRQITRLQTVVETATPLLKGPTHTRPLLKAA